MVRVAKTRVWSEDYTMLEEATTHVPPDRDTIQLCWAVLVGACSAHTLQIHGELDDLLLRLLNRPSKMLLLLWFQAGRLYRCAYASANQQYISQQYELVDASNWHFSQEWNPSLFFRKAYTFLQDCMLQYESKQIYHMIQIQNFDRNSEYWEMNHKSLRALLLLFLLIHGVLVYSTTCSHCCSHSSTCISNKLRQVLLKIFYLSRNIVPLLKCPSPPDQIKGQLLHNLACQCSKLTS